MWAGLNYLMTNNSTKYYVAINEIINVTPADEYLFHKGKYVLYGYDKDNKKVLDQTVIRSYSGSGGDGKFVIPENCYQLRVSFDTDASPISNLGVFRLTPTPEEIEELPLFKDGFRLKPQNIKDKAVVAMLAPLKDKVIINFGDSIFGNFSGEGSISGALAKHTGATVHNCGFGGCRMASHHIANFDAFSMYRLADAIATQTFVTQDTAIESGKTAATESDGKLPAYFENRLATLKGIDFNEVDIITIAYGTNDLTGEIIVDNENDLYNTNSFAGALRHSIETILTAYPHIRIFVCSQTNRFWTSVDGDTYISGIGTKLTDFVAKTKEVAEAYHLPFIDNYYELGFNKFNRSVYFPATDGTHPNETGRELIAKHIASKLF